MPVLRRFALVLFSVTAIAITLCPSPGTAQQTASTSETWLPPPVAPATDAASAAATALPATATPAAGGSTNATADPLSAAIAERLAAGPSGKPTPDREAMVRFYAERAHAPLWTVGKKSTKRAVQALNAFDSAAEYGLAAQDFLAPSLDADADAARADAEIQFSELVLKYARHARGGRMDPRQLSNDLDRDLPLLAPASVLAEIAKTDDAGAYLRGLNPRHPQFEKLRLAYVGLQTGDAAAKAKAQRVLLSMEQWRWMPEDLGQLYVWVNIPEFMIRVVKDGRVIHSERVIVGLTDKQTPVFSDLMETVVFHPTWGVPDSIKVKEILPSLLKGGKVLARHNLRIAQGAKDVDVTQIDWTKADIRNYHVYQPPGGANVLGVVKFLFPNKHQVYMHDTPTKNLFSSAQRTFSHGCMRVRDPLALAAVLLTEDKGWPQSRVAALAQPGSGQNNGVGLSRKIPVHITYFTSFVDADGKLEQKADVYGHEKRIQMGLEGKAHLIPKTKVNLAEARAEVIARLGEARQTSGGSGGGGKQPDWASRAFGN